MDGIAIRQETEKDYRAVEELTRNSFWNVYKPGADEHFYVHTMRNHPDFIPELAFVLEKDGEIIGNIMYTKAWLEDETGKRKEIVSFGPLCVAPEYQRQKLGKILIEHSFDAARKMGYDVNINFGNPGNYVSRGFVSCKKKNVSFYVHGNYPTALLVCELVSGVLDGMVGPENIICEGDGDIVTIRTDNKEVKLYNRLRLLEQFMPYKIGG